MLSTFGPLSLDLYLPALPELATDLAASTSAAQLTLTACLVGLATGQVIAGPLSDRFGRRRPLLIGLAAYTLTSIACAFAWSITVLVVLRLAQGLAGAAGLVIARAVARDLYEGRALAVFFSRLVLVAGLAPIIAPVLGGQLSRVMSWRGIFVVLAAFGLALLLAGWFGVRETLPVERRVAGHMVEVLRGFGILVRDRLFLGAALSAGLAGGAMFGYIAGSTFVLQRIYGLSPQGFSIVFGVNSVGLMAAGHLSGRLVRRWSGRRILAAGLVANLLGSLGLLVSVLLGLGLPFVLVSLFVLVSAMGLVIPQSTALAMAHYPDRAGTASALFGLLQFAVGGLAAPLVGLGGEDTAVPLGAVAAVSSLAACAVYAVLVIPVVRRSRADAQVTSSPEPPYASG